MTLFISLFTIFVNLYLGLLVFIRNPKSVTHGLFVLFTIFVAIWSLTNYLSLSADNPAEALLKIRVVLSVAVLMFSILYFFSVNFPAANWRLPPAHFGIIIVFSFSIIFLVFTPLVFRGISMQNGIITPIPNFGLFFYSLSIIGLPIASSVVLIRKFRSAEGTERGQLKFLSSGIIITFILTTVTNFLLVNVFKFTTLVVLGPFFTLIFVAFSTYAILRHHLMGIRIILMEALVSFIAFILLIDIFASQDIYQKFLRAGIFLVFFFFAYLLVKSVLKERANLEKIKDLAESLKIANLELKKLNKAKSEFISIASHQLRTPLAAIKGYVSMILGDTYGKVEKRVRKILNNVYESNERLIALINDLLNISRLEAGKIELEPEKFSLETMVLGIMDELKMAAENKKLYLKCRVAEQLPEITADRGKVRQIVLNIIDNAIKYTTQGGIAVEVKNADRQTGKIQIIIKDTGEGMIKEEVKSIFQIFSRGKAGNKLWTEGTGLGLYTAKKFAEMHGGRVWAESPGKGRGSTFYIELPLK